MHVYPWLSCCLFKQLNMITTILPINNFQQNKYHKFLAKSFCDIAFNTLSQNNLTIQSLNISKYENVKHDGKIQQLDKT